MDLTVMPGAPFEGRAVRDLGLPPGCILICLRRGVREEIPTADTRLASGDQITALVAPGAEDGVQLLRHGTSP